MSDVNHEQCCRDTAYLRNTTQYLFHLFFLTGKCQALFLGYAIQCSVSQHFFNAKHSLNALTNGIEIGKHTTQPTLSNKRHVNALCSFGNNFLRLLFSGNEHDLLTTACNRFHCSCSLLKTFNSLIQVNDMNPFLLSKDVRKHLGVPFLFQVPEVYACFK